MRPSAFDARGLRFEFDDGFTVVRFSDPVTLHEEALDARLSSALEARAPEAALLPSWILARLAAISSTSLPFESEVEICEDGVFVLDLLAAQPDGRVIAKLQLQAGRGAAGLLVISARPEHQEAAIEALLDALLVSPDQLEVCQVEVASAPEAPVSRYGYDGERLLT